jgi:hypothetical protein
VPIAHDPIAAVRVGGGGWFAAPDADALPALVVGAAWRPRGLGVALGGTLAPDNELAAMTFSGEVRAWSVAAEARYTLEVVPRVFVAPAAGLALYGVTVRGEGIDARRYNPALRLGVSAALALGQRLEIGIGVSGDCLLQRQRYEAQAVEILQISRVQAQAALFVGVML